MRMGGFSRLTRRRVPLVTHTHALFAGQSHSIPDNLVALLGHSRAWNCSDAERLNVRYYGQSGVRILTESFTPVARAGPSPFRGSSSHSTVATARALSGISTKLAASISKTSRAFAARR